MVEYTVTVGEYAPGTIRFYKPGTNDLHRLDGPAIINSAGDKFWYQDNNRHRTDGPAVEYTDDGVEYWINGEELTESQFKQKTSPKPKQKEMTIAEIEAILGHTVKVVK